MPFKIDKDSEIYSHEFNPVCTACGMNIGDDGFYYIDNKIHCQTCREKYLNKMKDSR